MARFVLPLGHLNGRKRRKEYVLKLNTVFVASAVMLTACSVGPDFVRPNTDNLTTSSFLNASGHVAETQSMGLWWHGFEDDALNVSVETLLKQNLDVKQAGARVLQSEENLRSSLAGFLPSFSATGNASRSGTPTGTGSRTYGNSFSATGALSWQLDVFGKVRRTYESSRASFKASKFDAEAVTHSLIAELISLRIQIAAQKKQTFLAEDAFKNRERTHMLLQQRYKSGANGVTSGDVLLAAEAMSTAQANFQSAERALKTLLFSYDVLLGQKIGTSMAENITFNFDAEPEVFAMDSPASLLDRRPDLKASELRLKASNANIGVAVADLYPDLTVSGSLGFTSTEFSRLFRSEQIAGSIAAGITQKLFEGGRLRAQIRLRKAQTEELVYAYTETVLTALKEVETALMAEEALRKERTALKASLEAMRASEEIYYTRYTQGMIPLKTYLDIQQSRLGTEQRYVTLVSDQWQKRIELYLALGGDWFAGPEQSEDPIKTDPAEDMFLVQLMRKDNDGQG